MHTIWKSASDRARTLLLAHPRVHYALPTVVARARQQADIRSYLGQSGAPRLLRIGSGPHVDEGWLCTDFNVTTRGITFLDARRAFPLPGGSFDAVACEHMIEHVGFEQGRALLAECRRVLRRGGVLRISTPDLDTVRRLPDRPEDPVVSRYLVWSNDTFGTPSERADASNPAFVVNRLMREWGHTFLYDEPTLRRALADAGFPSVTRAIPGRSEIPYLVGVDRHMDEIGEAFDALETMVFEAVA